MKKILLSCGGTGGHIYPAIAIASKIKEHQPDAEILFIGTKKGMENRLVPDAGFEIRGIDASGLNRTSIIKNVKTLENMIHGSREAAAIIKEFAPDAAVGTGGYVTWTVISQAHRAGIPCFIHEQNAVPGLTNKLLQAYADKVFISFEESVSSFRHPEKTVFTGNPIRAQFTGLSKTECRKALGIADEERFILLFGGSLGAEVLNEACLRLIDEMPENGIKLCFVTGRRYYEQIAKRLKEEGLEKPCVTLLDYADNMPVLMKASDLVISRAGAIALSEILACARPSVLVPSPNVTNNHQYYNAKAAADAGASVLIEEKDITGDLSRFSRTVLALAEDDERLGSMSLNASAIAVTDAAERIYRELGLE